MMRISAVMQRMGGVWRIYIPATKQSAEGDTVVAAQREARAMVAAERALPVDDVVFGEVVFNLPDYIRRDPALAGIVWQNPDVPAASPADVRRAACRLHEDGYPTSVISQAFGLAI